MAGNDKDLPSEETVRRMLEVQSSEIEARRDEIEARSADRENHKEVALAAIEAERTDRAEQRQLSERKSRLSKRFVTGLVLIGVVFILVLVWLGQSEAIFGLLQEAIKYIFGGLGGAGLTLIYLNMNGPRSG